MVRYLDFFQKTEKENDKSRRDPYELSIIAIISYLSSIIPIRHLILFRETLTFIQLVEIAFPFLAIFIILYFLYSIYKKNPDSRSCFTIVGWFIAIFLLFLSTSLITFFHQLSEGVHMSDPFLFVNNISVYGGLLGILIGYYNFERKEETRKLENKKQELEEEKKRIEEFSAKLENANDKLKFVNQLLRHDIRNDINIVRINAQELKNKNNKGVLDNVETILQKCDHIQELTTIARDITDLADKNELKPKNLKDSLYECINETENTYPEIEIKIKGEIPDIEVRADDLIKSLFNNILSNAIEHNDKENPVIKISTEEKNSRVKISIADNGPGIPDYMKEKIFKFGQKGNKSSGTGLGLYLVQTLIKNYGGYVDIEDNKPEGSIFIIELKKA